MGFESLIHAPGGGAHGAPPWSAYGRTRPDRGPPSSSVAPGLFLLDGAYDRVDVEVAHRVLGVTSAEPVGLDDEVGRLTAQALAGGLGVGRYDGRPPYGGFEGLPPGVEQVPARLSGLTAAAYALAPCHSGPVVIGGHATAECCPAPRWAAARVGRTVIARSRPVTCSSLSTLGRGAARTTLRPARSARRCAPTSRASPEASQKETPDRSMITGLTVAVRILMISTRSAAVVAMSSSPPTARTVWPGIRRLNRRPRAVV